MDRRLSAIFAADMVGYSRLMEADEIGTLERQKFHRQELIDPCFAKFHGRIFKEMGDGILVEFLSVVQAVQCAVEIQRSMPEREAEIASDRRIRFRIGINLGDIIVDDDDIYGDGVNVAARLETLAEPGGICISGSTYDQMRSNVAVGYESMGDVNVKNISRPIRAYKVLTDSNMAGQFIDKPSLQLDIRTWAAIFLVLLLAAGGGSWWWQQNGTDAADMDGAVITLPDKPSIAVLPFESLSEEREDEYYAFGMTDDLTTELAKVSGLILIAPSSTQQYEGSSATVSEVASALNVRYVVKGTVRRTGERLRINTQLVDSKTGAHVWAERYDRGAQDILSLQDEVRASIVSALKVGLSPSEKANLGRSKTNNAEAYDAYLRARRQESYFTRESTIESIRLYRLALERDPDFVDATARLSITYTLAADNGWVADTNEGLELARNLANQAIAKNDSLPVAYWALARYYTRDETWDTERAINALETAISIDPNYADGFAMLANTLHFVGRAEEGLAHIETAMRLNPNFPFWYYFALGANQYHLTRFDAARQSFEKGIERNASWQSNYRYLVSTLGHLGLTEEAEWQMEELRALGFEPNMESWRERDKHQDPVYKARYFEGLRKAGVPEN